MENNTSLQQQLLEAGVHFGHLKKKWNPKMLPYIFAEKKGIHIIDLNKTVEGLQETAAALIRTAISQTFGEGVYETEIDDGEDVLVKTGGTTPVFDLVLVRNTAQGLELDLERE